MNRSLKLRAIVAIAAISAAATDPAIARNEGKLPKNATPLSAEQTKAVYAGKTINWKPARVYWNPNGTAIGIYPKKGDEYFSEGTWTVKGNEICYHLNWHGAKKAKKPDIEDGCEKFYFEGKKLWIENTKKEPKWQGDIWSGIESKLKTGDSASKPALALKTKFGY